MQRIHILVLCQVILCWVATYLISKISLIGRIGIAVWHKEYKLLRSGWKTFLLFLGIQLVVITVLYLVRKKFPGKHTIKAATILLVIAILGLLTTYMDFQDTYSHRLLKERFHLGFYLFWLGWIGSCIFFLVSPGKGKKDIAENVPVQDTQV